MTRGRAHEDVTLRGDLLRNGSLRRVVEEIESAGGVLTKLADRGSYRTTGLVTVVEPFFRELLSALDDVEG